MLASITMLCEYKIHKKSEHNQKLIQGRNQPSSSFNTQQLALCPQKDGEGGNESNLEKEKQVLIG